MYININENKHFHNNQNSTFRLINKNRTHKQALKASHCLCINTDVVSHLWFQSPLIIFSYNTG